LKFLPEAKNNYKNLIIPALVFIISILSAANSLSSGRIPETIVKVSILDGQNEVHIKSDGAYKAVDMRTMRCRKYHSGKDYIVTPEGNDGVRIEDKTFSAEVRFVPLSNDFIRINGRRYRDTVLIQNTNGRLTVINELGVDGYLFGVLPVEVSPKWPIEALKAQAVVSRTYVMNNLGKYGKKGYDLSSDVFSQMYRGVEAEHPETNRAVKETSGMVLTYKGKLAKAYFHSSCGGYTENIQKVWGNAVDFMKGITCPYCKDSPRYHWEKNIEPEFIQSRLAKAGYTVGKIKNIKFKSRTKSGRIDLMEIIHSLGTLEITGHKFRMAIGPDIIKSAMMAIDRNKNKFSFYGRGWGHGIGMCQWGARGLAERGSSFRNILKFYFPGTKVKKWVY